MLKTNLMTKINVVENNMKYEILCFKLENKTKM